MTTAEAPPLRPTPLARGILARAGRPIPRYGSAEWDALPDGDLRRVAAIVIAAEAWRDHCSTARVAAELAEQLARDDELVVARLARAAADVRCAIPTLAVTPWWTRVCDAEAYAKRQARQHWEDFERRRRGAA